MHVGLVNYLTVNYTLSLIKTSFEKVYLKLLSLELLFKFALPLEKWLSACLYKVPAGKAETKGAGNDKLTSEK